MASFATSSLSEAFVGSSFSLAASAGSSPFGAGTSSTGQSRDAQELLGDAAKHEPSPAAPSVRAHSPRDRRQTLSRARDDAVCDVVAGRVDLEQAGRAFNALLLHRRGGVGEHVRAFLHERFADVT